MALSTSTQPSAADFWDSVYAKTGNADQATRATTQKFGPPPTGVVTQPSTATGPQSFMDRANQAEQNVNNRYLLPFLQGVAFNQMPNLAGVGAAIVPGGKGFDEGKAAMKQRLAQGRAEAPVGSTIAELFGSIVGPNPLSKIKALQGMQTAAEGAGTIGKVVRRGVVGGIQGGIMGGVAAAGEGDLSSAGPGALVGMVAGATLNNLLAPFLAKATQKGEHWLAKEFGDATAAVTTPNPRARELAYGKLYDRLLEYGVSNPEDAIPVMKAMDGVIPAQTRYMALADYFPDAVNLKKQLAATASSPGKAPQIMANFIRQRVGGPTSPDVEIDRALRITNDLFGKTPKGSRLRLDVVKKARQVKADRLFERVRGDMTPVTDPDLAFLAATPEGQAALLHGRQKALTKAATQTGKGAMFLQEAPPVRLDPTTGAVTSPLTVADVYALREGFQDLALAVRTQAGLDKTGAKVKDYLFKPYLDRVDEIGRAASPLYAEAIDTYRKYSNVIAAVQAAPKALQMNADDITATMRKLETPGARKIFQEGYLRTLQDKLLRSKDPISLLDNPMTKAQFAVVFADRPDVAMNVYQAALGAEAAMRSVNRGPFASIGGSAGRVGQDFSTFAGRELTTSGRPQVGAWEAVADLLRGMREQLDDEVAEELASAATATGSDLYAVLRSLKRATPPSQRVAKVAGQMGGSATARTVAPVGTTLTP